MSVFINMKMPDSCAACRLMTVNDGCALIGAVGYALTKGERSTDCPLRPLPSKHGRLIDEDRLVKRFCGHCEEHIRCEEECFDLKLIRNTDAVIEAEYPPGVPWDEVWEDLKQEDQEFYGKVEEEAKKILATDQERS